MKAIAPAKINVFLKITGIRGNYHELRSRFMRVETLYDTIEFIPGEYENFRVEGCMGVPQEKNTITKAFLALLGFTQNPILKEFFRHHAVRVTKRIPEMAGLGGGSSDAASFLLMANDCLLLGLKTDELAHIGARVGADVPFFIYGYPSANVSGIGEIIEPFDEEPLDIELFTPPVACNTALVYKTFRERFAHCINPEAGREWLKEKSADLLDRLQPNEANDLLQAALAAYLQMRAFIKPGWFLSGSGSTLFRPNPR